MNLALAPFSDSDCSPEIVIQSLSIPNGTVRVVRDDLLEGGTKQRAIAPYLCAHLERGRTRFLYASPFSGFAQVALAASAKKLGAEAILFCEAAPSGGAHEFTRLAESFGAKVYLHPTLSEAERAARGFEHKLERAFKIPLGFDCPDYVRLLQLALRDQWRVLDERIEAPVRRLWLPIGSGTLASVFRVVVPLGVELCCVDVHVLDIDDKRVQRVRALPRTQYFSAPEAFADRAGFCPPVDSNIHYDAKLWSFLQAQGRDGDVWWNVAR